LIWVGFSRSGSDVSKKKTGIPSDFTFYPTPAEFDALRAELDRAPDDPERVAPRPSDRYSCSCTLRIRLDGGGRLGRGRATTRAGRALVCRCFGGRHVSATWRKLDEEALPPAPGGAPGSHGVEWPSKAVPPPSAGRSRVRPFAAGGDPAIERMTAQLVDELWENLRLGDRSRGPLTGLIVVSGRTGSGKSDIARAFTRKYLEHRIAARPRRVPHLVTFEDPIEKRFADSPRLAADHGFDYTPREKDADVHSLDDALMDALRQTPDLVYVGETREVRDWKSLLHFAGTGHLAITTGHAGSLVETMAEILQAANVRNAAERSRVAGRIAALVHLRPYFPEDGVPPKVLVPAVWARNPRAISAFTAEGLGSILPSQPGDKAPLPGCYGRSHFCEKLDYLRKVAGLKLKAIEWDLRGE